MEEEAAAEEVAEEAAALTASRMARFQRRCRTDTPPTSLHTQQPLRADGVVSGECGQRFLSPCIDRRGQGISFGTALKIMIGLHYKIA